MIREPYLRASLLLAPVDWLAWRGNRTGPPRLVGGRPPAISGLSRSIFRLAALEYWLDTTPSSRKRCGRWRLMAPTSSSARRFQIGLRSLRPAVDRIATCSGGSVLAR